MNGYQNPFFNPYGYMQPQQPIQPQQPQQQVVRVNGENGAKAYGIGANSSALLLDESGTMVWLITSDGAGYKSVSAYDIVPHKTEPTPDFGNLENRISRLEEIINNGNTKYSSSTRKEQPKNAADKTDD